MINLDKFDPSDANNAMQAAEDAVSLSLYILRYKALNWPKDPTLHDGIWRDAANIIVKYGDLSSLNIPELYRDLILRMAKEEE